MGGMIDSTINSVRRIATELRPQILDTCGLLDALEWQGMDYQARTGIECQLELPKDTNYYLSFKIKKREKPSS